MEFFLENPGRYEDGGQAGGETESDDRYILKVELIPLDNELDEKEEEKEELRTSFWLEQLRECCQGQKNKTVGELEFVNKYVCGEIQRSGLDVLNLRCLYC